MSTLTFTTTTSGRDRTHDAPSQGAGNEWDNKRAVAQARRGAIARATNGRKKGRDPLTSEMNYTVDEAEFMNAMAEYIRTSGRKFPGWSEILEVLRGLGYAKP